MRPKPRARHLPAVLVFVAIAALHGGLAAMDHEMDDGQVSLATAALKVSGSGLFPTDPLFGPTGPVCSSSPNFVGGLGLILSATGDDPVWVLRLLAGPLVLLYLLGMYVLLYRQCRSWSIAAFVAALSTVVIPALGGSSWGLGTLASVGPTALPLALTPLIVLGLLDAIQQRGAWWRLPAVFLLAGLLSQFDLNWAINLTIVLAATYLVQRRFAAIACLAAVGCLVLAGAAALPAVVQCFAVRFGSSGGEAPLLSQMLREGGKALLYPQALRALPGWMIWAVPLTIPTVVILSQAERFDVPRLEFWIAFAVAAVAVALGLQVVSQGIGLVTGAIPPATGFVRASCFLMLPLYVLFAQALVNLFRWTYGHHGLVRTALAVAAAAWLIPSANLTPARHGTYAAASVLLSEEDKPSHLRQLQEAASRCDELAAIARWATNHTPPDAVFVTEISKFRLLSRRSIVAGKGDGLYLRCCQPGLLAEWKKRLTRQGQLLHPPAGKADPTALSQFVSELSSQPPLAAAGAWYVLLPAAWVPEGSAILTEEVAKDWGKCYRLYRIR